MRTIFGILVMLAALAVPPLYAGGGGGQDDAPVPPPNPDEDVLRPLVEAKGGPFIQIDGGINLTFLGVRDSSASVPTATVRQLRQREQAALLQSGSGVGPLFGVTFGYDFPKLFSVRLRLDYDVRSASNSGTATDTILSFNGAGFPVFTPIPVTKNYTVRATYLSISLLPQIRFDNLYFFAGPTISLPIGSKMTYDETDSIADPTGIKFHFQSSPSDSASSLTTSNKFDSLAKTRIALKIGAGYNIQIARKIFLVPQVAFDLGFTDAMTGDGTAIVRGAVTQNNLFFAGVNRKITLNALQLTLGIRFNLY